ncbi:MAG: LysR family transcriptional regulator, partial [Gammaproteobacteria bacterium]|nr:LysR family transcriptional regulator [Gammaproteobacteria bacterium]
MVNVRFRLDFAPGASVGPGKIDLLAAIDAEGSLSAAARSVGMSYRRAWLLVETMNLCFREPLVISARGGRGAGGARLTAEGEAVL